MDKIQFVKLLYRNQDTMGGILKYENKPWFFKFSRRIDFLMVHEYIIYKDCEKLSKYCANFPRRARLLRVDVPLDFYKKNNPFKIAAGDRTIIVECLLVEYIKGKTIHELRAGLRDTAISSVLKQCLIALFIAREVNDFTHYDLHLNNIILRPTSQEKIIYNFLDQKIEVETCGLIPVFIDFTFSYTRAVEGKNLCANLSLTNINYFPIVPNTEVDARALLFNLAGGFFNFERIVLNYPSVTDYILLSLDKYQYDSILFNCNKYACVDLIKYLIVLPAQEQTYCDFVQNYRKIAAEFRKLEDISDCNITNLVILKYMVYVFSLDIPLDEQKATIFTFISSFGQYHYPVDFDLEEIKRSMFEIARAIEGILFEYLEFSIEDIQNQESKNFNLKTLIDGI